MTRVDQPVLKSSAEARDNELFKLGDISKSA